MDHLTVEARACLAGDHHKLPRFQGTMVGDADTGGQNLLEMRRVDRTGMHGLGGDRSTGGQEFNDAAHGMVLRYGCYR